MCPAVIFFPLVLKMIEAEGEETTTSSSNSVTFAICSPSDEEDLDDEDYVEDPGSPKEDSANQGSTGCPIWIKV